MQPDRKALLAAPGNPFSNKLENGILRALGRDELALIWGGLVVFFDMVCGCQELLSLVRDWTSIVLA